MPIFTHLTVIMALIAFYMLGILTSFVLASILANAQKLF